MPATDLDGQVQPYLHRAIKIRLACLARVPGRTLSRSASERQVRALHVEGTSNLSRGAFRVTGIAKTSLMLGIYAAATNLRLLRSWTARNPSTDTPDQTDHDTGPDKPRSDLQDIDDAQQSRPPT